MRATPDQTRAWLNERTHHLAITSLEDLAAVTGSDKGNLSRVLRQLRSPRADIPGGASAGRQA